LRYHFREAQMDLPSNQSLRSIVKAFAHLQAAHGAVIGTPPLVQPTGEYFPDEFRADAPSVAQLLRRMMEYAPLSSELGVELSIVMPEADHMGGCGSAVCGPAARGSSGVGVIEVDDRYRVVVAATDVGHPDVLSTSLARSVGALVLHEAGEPVGSVASEIAAVVCGFGVVLLNGSSVWAKSCGGLRMAQATAMPVEETAVALALFVALHDHRVSLARKHLGATQREAFDLAQDWVESNPMLIASLRDRPERLESGAVDLEPVRGPIGQWLYRRRLERDLRVPPKSRVSTISEERRRRLEEVNALLMIEEESEPEAP
jgi:hypothetical protein